MRQKIVNFIIVTIAINCFVTFAYAATKTQNDHSKTLPWSLELGWGYGEYLHMYGNDGKYVLSRIGIAKEIVKLKWLHTGLEIGIQGGNVGRLNVPQTTLNLMGGLAINSIMKPTIDLLITNKLYLPNYNSLYTQIKAGIIMRRWQFTEGSINDITLYNPEIQFGIGRDINRLISLSLSYQLIAGKNPNYQIITNNCLGHVASMPGENAVILGLSIYLNEGIV